MGCRGEGGQAARRWWLRLRLRLRAWLLEEEEEAAVAVLSRGALLQSASCRSRLLLAQQPRRVRERSWVEVPRLHVASEPG